MNTVLLKNIKIAFELLPIVYWSFSRSNCWLFLVLELTLKELLYWKISLALLQLISDCFSELTHLDTTLADMNRDNFSHDLNFDLLSN